MAKLIYLANPLGFSEIGRSFKGISDAIKLAGYEVLDPWQFDYSLQLKEIEKLPLAKQENALHKLSMQIGEKNKEAIDKSDGLVAVLDGADTGTAAEIGYAKAKEKPIVGYYSDFRLAGDNKGVLVNLQVQYFIEASGGFIARNIEELEYKLKHEFQL